ncbi:MAG: hypothetical protein KIS72_01090 [Luteimonas sp.]|nr:hypothetical protein [Luteimonas sp.]
MKIIILLVLLLTAQGVEASPPSFEGYAERFIRVVSERNNHGWMGLVGDGYVLSESNMEYAFKRSANKGSKSLYDIMSSGDPRILIDLSKVSDDEWIARIYFVEKSKIKYPRDTSVTNVFGLKRNVDYVVCEVVYEHGKYRMRDHFCYDETDI